METMEITMDGKNYVPAEKYDKLLDNMCEFSKKNLELEKRIVELTQENAVMAKQLNLFIELPDYRPITVARALINVKRMIGEYGIKENRYSTSELRQIAEHLLVYCNEGKKQ